MKIYHRANPVYKYRANLLFILQFAAKNGGWEGLYREHFVGGEAWIFDLYRLYSFIVSKATPLKKLGLKSRIVANDYLHFALDLPIDIEYWGFTAQLSVWTCDEVFYNFQLLLTSITSATAQRMEWWFDLYTSGLVNEKDVSKKGY